MSGATTPLTEFSIIELLRQRCAGKRSDVVLGIGDDAAVTRVPAGRELVTATDALVEGTHFLPGAAPASIGHRCLAVNLSDLAAMGATPHWAMLSLAVPAADEAWLNDFAGAFAQLAAAHGVSLIGGDTVKGPLSVSVTVMGTVAAGAAVKRNGAVAGECIWLTGAPGQAAAGRHQIAGVLPETSAGDVYRQCFEFPVPRVEFGAAVAPLASAMIDISDGVAVDLGRLLAASGMGAAADVPDLQLLQDDFGTERARELFLFGGEDYELCFTAACDADAQIMALAGQQQLPLVRLGTVSSAPGLQWRQNGEPVAAEASGFEHFVV